MLYNSKIQLYKESSTKLVESLVSSDESSNDSLKLRFKERSLD